MFDDKRSKKVIFLAHCLLNQNSISDSTADFPSQFNEVIHFLMENEIGMIQLPCPELTCLGLDRGDINGYTRPVIEENTRIRKMMCQKNNLEKIQVLVQSAVYQITEYLKNGFDIKGVIGINRSPSCGVETTSKDSSEINGQGIFIEVLQDELKKQNIQLDFIGVKTSEPEKAINDIKNLFGEIQ
jgi:predicted secreted protein